MSGLLEKIKNPEQLMAMDEEGLLELSVELREKIIETVSLNGGHLASNLGVVELTLALLKVFNFRRDRIVFDVGHQTYAWKLLTGRMEQFCTLRQYGGMSGFPKQEESCYDFFNTGHSSTSISAALGLARALKHTGKAGRAIALIGDGALTGGMAFEALNDAGHSGENLLVILNDNQMSISRNVGGLSRHLENLRVSPHYLKAKSRMEPFLCKIPLIGKPLYRFLMLFKKTTKMALQQHGGMFEHLGFSYYGPIDGHDLESLVEHLEAIRKVPGPILLHVLTQKGRGYHYAEKSPDLYHGVAPFVIEDGLVNGRSTQKGKQTFSQRFGKALTELAARDSRICAISAAMTAGTGLGAFSQQYPARFFDVGIAEQHAMTLAAGLAAGNMRPVIALYSTFLQRAYDQLLHDVCLQCLPVVIAIDRAGIVGEDGETHQGIYDLSLLLPLPGLEVYCPADFQQLEAILDDAVSQQRGPVAIRYPRGGAWPEPLPEPLQRDDDDSLLPLQKARLLRRGDRITLAPLGTMAGPALEAAKLLAEDGIEADVLAFTCAKPIDHHALQRSASRTKNVLFIEESLCEGGFAQHALPTLIKQVPGVSFACRGVEDQPLCQGSRDQLLQMSRLMPQEIAAEAKKLLQV